MRAAPQQIDRTKRIVELSQKLEDLGRARNVHGAPALLQDMQDRILALAPGYFGHADFAARFILKKWAERQELQQWQRLDTRGDGA